MIYTLTEARNILSDAFGTVFEIMEQFRAIRDAMARIEVLIQMMVVMLAIICLISVVLCLYFCCQNQQRRNSIPRAISKPAGTGAPSGNNGSHYQYSTGKDPRMTVHKVTSRDDINSGLFADLPPPPSVSLQGFDGSHTPTRSRSPTVGEREKQQLLVPSNHQPSLSCPGSSMTMRRAHSMRRTLHSEDHHHHI